MCGINASMLDEARKAMTRGGTSYISKESTEHQIKSRAIQTAPGPKRTCIGCGKGFRQTTRFGKTLYCTASCRDNFYAQQKKEATKNRYKHLICLGCRKEFQKTKQFGMPPLYCTTLCRDQFYAQRKKRPPKGLIYDESLSEAE